MLKSELANRIAVQFDNISMQHVHEYTSLIVNAMSEALCHKKRIEIRGFGSVTLRYRRSRQAHNPKTGEQLITIEKYRPHFKSGKELRQKLNLSPDKQSAR